MIQLQAQSATRRTERQPLQRQAALVATASIAFTMACGASAARASGLSFTNYTTTNGLGSNTIYGISTSDSTIYAATYGGLGISTNGGSTFINRTTANGLPSNDIRDVYTNGSNVYVAAYGGLAISTDGGASFTNRTTANGLGSNSVFALS